MMVIVKNTEMRIHIVINHKIRDASNIDASPSKKGF